VLLSIVTGTYSRLPYLKQMVSSVRVCLPRGMDYEFVLVDGGSTDGTLEWAREQPDVVLIEQGELLGAIRAFDAGAEAARGDYVILGNDDIRFHANSIIPAIVYLEMHPECGAVAFADNRPAPGYGDGYKVQTMSVRDTDGVSTHVPYAQVGMFRRWLGETCQWWGSRHPIMSQGHTYGGDNFLSARIYQLGYTICAVDDCKIDDLIPTDDLRERNHQIEQQNPAVYYKAFPQPPQFVTPPTLPNPQDERLRILYLPIYERNAPLQQLHKRGLREALQRQGLVYEIDFVNTRYNLAEAARVFQPHLLFIQAHGPSIPVQQLHDARAAHPSMIVVNWNGDVHEAHLTSPEVLAWLKHVDLQLTVNNNVLPEYARAGIPASYWQVSFEPVDYDNLPDVIAHDVVFLANCYSDERRALGLLLQALPGINVGLYGRGWQWGNGDCSYIFPVSTALYARAKIAIGDSQYSERVGFVSNRIFEALASGAFLLHQTIPGLQELTGIVEGEHFIGWTDAADLQTKIHYWLAKRHEEKRRSIAAAGRAYVQANHSFDVRVQELFALIQEKVGKRESAA